jgi:hypothetical protein
MRFLLALGIAIVVLTAAIFIWTRDGEESSGLSELDAVEVLRKAAAADRALQTFRAELLLETRFDDGETVAYRAEMMVDRGSRFVLIRGDLEADSPATPYFEQFFDGSTGRAYTRMNSGSEWLPEHNMYVLSGAQALLTPEAYEESPNQYGIARETLSSGERVYHLRTSNFQRSSESYIRVTDFHMVKGTRTFEITQSGFRIWTRYSYSFHGFNEPIVFPRDLPKP